MNKRIRAAAFAVMLLCIMACAALTAQAANTNTDFVHAAEAKDGQTVTVSFESYGQELYYYVDTSAMAYIKLSCSDAYTMSTDYADFWVGYENSAGVITAMGTVWEDEYGTERLYAVSGYQKIYLRITNYMSDNGSGRTTGFVFESVTAKNKNTGFASAIEATSGKTVDVSFDFEGQSLYYYVDTSNAGSLEISCPHLLAADYPSESYIDAAVYYADASGTYTFLTPLVSAHGTARVYDAGEFQRLYFYITNYYNYAYYGTGSAPMKTSFTVRTMEKKTVTPDAPCIITMEKDDTYAFLSVEPDQVGMDLAITASGYDYQNSGSFRVNGLSYSTSWGDYRDYVEIGSNQTQYVHLKEADVQTIWLEGASTRTGPITFTFELLEGDGNELNETKEAATALTVGTDCAFHLGGEGDVDWFRFEISLPDGADSAIYTLRFLDFNTDYSDTLTYTLYAPDGTQVASHGLEIEHSNILELYQEGMYSIEVKPSGIITRSPLRVRIDEGGDDPYENNDTWLKAAQIASGQTIQHYIRDVTDVDWFWFEAEEPDMTLMLSGDSYVSAELCSGAQMKETGYGSTLHSFGLGSGSQTYYKLTDAGVYYLQLHVGESGASNRLRSFDLKLLPARDDENNDYWKRATRLWPNTLKSFDLSAFNDTDIFEIRVPEGVSALLIGGNLPGWFDIYKRSDYIQFGDRVNPVFSSSEASMDPYSGYYRFDLEGADAYYLTFSDGRQLNRSVKYCFIGSGSFRDAEPIPEGEWTIPADYTKVYDLGYLDIGDSIRVSRKGSGTLELLNADGETVDSSEYAHAFFTVTEIGQYYLRVNVNNKSVVYTSEWVWDPDQGMDVEQLVPYEVFSAPKEAVSVRCDIGRCGDGELKDLSIQHAEELTLGLGETRWLDLRVFDPAVEGKEKYRAWLDAFFAEKPATYTVGLFREEFDDETGERKALVPAEGISYDPKTGCLTVDEMAGGAYVLVALLDADSNCPEPIEINIFLIDEIPVVIHGMPETMTVGEVVMLETEGASGTITWTSSDESVLYVSPSGVLTAVGEGKAHITLTCGIYSDVELDSGEITVYPTAEEKPVTAVRLDKYTLTLFMEEEGGKLAASVIPEDAAAGKTVRWSSSNENAALVDNEGNVTAVAPGISIVTAEVSGDGYSVRASCIVTVHAKRIRVESIAFERETIELPLGGSSALKVIFTPENATTRTLLWLSSDESTVSVSRTGVVSALAVGEATITATSADGEHTASILVRVTAKPQKGDINGDGYIDSADAMLALLYAVSKTELTAEQLDAGDVNGDGVVDAGDAVRILRYDAGLIDRVV